MVSSLVLFATLLTLAAAKPMGRSAMVVHESLTNVPFGFVQSGAASPDTQLKLRIALVQNNPSGLVDSLYAVSTPGSASYGQHLSKEEVESFVAPTPQTAQAVNGWLQAAGVKATTISPSGDWLSITVPVSTANELFGTEFTVFTHSKTGKETIRTLSYSIPSELTGHLNFVHPTVIFPETQGHLPVVSTPLSNQIPLDVCNGEEVVPACVQSLYGIPTALATQASNTLGVSGFIKQFANQADLTTFMQVFRPDVTTATTFSLQTIDGGQNPQDGSEAGDEANLDTQYTVGIASGVPTTFISVGANTNDGFAGFLDIINFLLSETNPPHVLTTSYGFNEGALSRSATNNLCNAYAQLSARGTSILFSSGDGGVSGTQAGSCSAFVPTFPSGCPFVTSVGATQVSDSGAETAASFSSGGFSNYFDRPSYQSAAVASYLTTLGSTDSGLFNVSGRAFPDVAAVGVDVVIVVDGEGFLVEGTSCSSPIFASIIALLNDQLIAAGRSPLGFLNPFLYANPGVFNDITSGSNPGCNTNGFPAGAGWDPVTGLGTPNFAKLKAAAGL